MRRLNQLLLLASLGWLSWLGMMAVHEGGHVLGAWATGGQVRQVVWHPRVLSRTDIRPNPAPLVAVWAGPIVGAALPGLVYAPAVALRSRAAPLLGFFAGFCLIANGTYIGIGAASGIADAGVMILLGSPRWVLAAFGAVSAMLGLYVWHRESAWFGFGPDARPIGGQIAGVAVAAAVLALTLSWMFGNAG